MFADQKKKFSPNFLVMQQNIIVLLLLIFFNQDIFSQESSNPDFQTNNPNLLLFSFLNMDKYPQIFSIEQALTTYKPSNIKPVIFTSQTYKKQISLIEKTIPLDFNPIVEQYIEHYLVTRKKQTEILLGLLQEYDIFLTNTLKSRGLPVELKYIPAIRSAMDPSAVASNGTTGFWQFAYPIARYYGLAVDSYIDERRDYRKSTIAALSYLKDLSDIYKDWTLTLAAYNCGPGNVNKAIRRAKGKTGFWEIYEYLPAETRDLVPLFYAFSYVANFYRDHNLTPVKIIFTNKPDTIHINYKISLKQVSGIVDLPYTQVIEMNPVYKKDIIPGGERTYILSLPIGHKPVYLSRKDSMFALSDSIAALKIAEDSLLIGSTDKQKIEESSLSNKYHTVKTGESLGSISRKHGTSVGTIKKWNGLRSDVIHPGQKLIVKKSVKATPPVSKKENNATITASSESKTGTNPSSEWHYYVVKQGDNLYSIAKKYPGITEKDLMEWNNIKDPKYLQAGQKLKIKR